MPSLEQIIGIALASFVIIVVPGPSVMFIIGRALSYGRRVALATVVGNSIGSYLACAAIALGLGPLLERSDTLFQVIKWAGVAYLIWLGVQAFRHAAPIDPERVEAEPHRAMRTPAAIRAGLIVGVTNPKAFILFSAIMPQFVDPARGSLPIQLLLLGIVPVLFGTVTDSVWALAAGQAREWLGKTPKRMTAFGRVGGISIAGVGVAMGFTQH